MPSLDDVAHKRATDLWFRSVLEHFEETCDSDEEFPFRVPPYAAEATNENGKWMSLWHDPDDDDEIECKLYDYEDYVPYIPYFRRLGYGISLAWDPVDPEDDDDTVGCSLDLWFQAKGRVPRGCLPEDKLRIYNAVKDDWVTGTTVHLPTTDAKMIRFRGVLKCVPRFLALMWIARSHLADPNLPRNKARQQAERDADLAPSADPPHWKSEAALVAEEQCRRKRQLVDAIHCDDEDRRKGAKWFHIRSKWHADTNPHHPRPMRIDSVEENLFIFQEKCDGHYDWTVTVLHHEAFDVALWPTEDGFRRKVFEYKFERRLKDEEDVSSYASDSDDE